MGIVSTQIATIAFTTPKTGVANQNLPEVTERVKDLVCEFAFAEIATAEQEDRERADGVRTTGVVAREALDGTFEGFLWTLRASGPETRQQLTAHYLDRLIIELKETGRAAA
jgi:hypothetical protein